MKITTKAHYGLMAMCELAKNYGNPPVSVKEVSKLQDCSDSYMEQIFSLLKKADLIKSIRGAYGGYQLKYPPEEISVGQIIRALEGPIGFTNCSHDLDSGCSLDQNCCSQNFWKELYQNINTFLEEKKLSDLIQSPEKLTNPGN